MTDSQNPVPEPTAPPAGSILTITIDDVAFGGDGVGRFDGCVIFVPFTLPGEMVEVEVTEAKKRFARARLLKVLQVAEGRVEPLCAHYTLCGGCQYQHAAYDLQISLKRKQVATLLEKIGKFPYPPVLEVVPCPQPYHYRNRLMIRSQWNKNLQRLMVGFLQAESRLVVEIDECKIAEPALNDRIRHARANPPHKGGIKVVLRIPPEDWEVPKDSFFQNNFFLLPELVRVARERVQDSGVRYLVDAYCGVGFFSIQLAGVIERFAGVELDRPAIKAARKNAEKFKALNGEYIEGDATLLMPEMMRKFPPSQTCVLLDPPRTGCSPESLAAIIEARPAQVLYVSCHPATLSRDLRHLCDHGYALRSVTPLDMFPQTQHLECVADLRLVKEPPAGQPDTSGQATPSEKTVVPDRPAFDGIEILSPGD